MIERTREPWSVGARTLAGAAMVVGLLGAGAAVARTGGAPRHPPAFAASLPIVQTPGAEPRAALERGPGDERQGAIVVEPVAEAHAAFAIEPVGSLPAAAPALHVTVRGDVAFVPAHASGVRIVDIQDPGQPRLLATAPTEGAAYEAAVKGDRLYVAAWSAGLEIFDVADPAAPRRLGGAPTRANAGAIAVLPGDVVVTGDWSAADFEGGDPDYGLLAFDVADPAAPRAIGRLDTPGWAGEVAADGSRLYVADGPGGLRIVDASDPAALVEVGAAPTDVRAYGVAVAGERALVADNAGGLVIFDVSDPAHPSRLGQLETGEAAYAVAFDPARGRAWLAQAAGGGPADAGSVVLVDVARPAAPRILARAETRQRAWGVALGGAESAWVAATGAGLLGFRVVESGGPAGLWLPWAGAR